jgi:hypothetical protein
MTGYRILAKQQQAAAARLVAKRSLEPAPSECWIVAFAIARPSRARERKQSCRARAAHAWIWVEAVVTRTACGDGRQLPFVRIDKAERTLSGADVASPAHLSPDSGQLRDAVRFRSHGFHE